MTEKAHRERGLGPKLRFPEFVQLGAWDFKPLKSLAKRRTERNAGEKIVRVLTNSAEYGVVDQKDYFDKDIATKGNLDTYFIVAEGDYVYNPRVSSLAPVGPIHKNKIGTGVMSPLYTAFRFDSEENGFYEHYFRSTHWHDYLRLISNTGARHDRMAISNGDFFEMPLPAPDLIEQQKIAECLSSLDALIAAETDKLTALKVQKIGLMQQLFPVEGGTTPRLRFPEFRNAGEWKPKAINEIAEIYKGRGISKSDIVLDGTRSCIRYGELYTTYGEIIDEIYSSTNANESELFFSVKNDVIIPASGESKIDIATASCVMKDGVALGSDLNVIRSSENGIFLSYFLNGPLKHKIARVAQGDAVVHLYPAQIGSLKVAIPHAQEQHEIAACLASLDSLIVGQRNKLVALKNHRKGLIHQLFASHSVLGS